MARIARRSLLAATLATPAIAQPASPSPPGPAAAWSGWCPSPPAASPTAPPASSPSGFDDPRPAHRGGEPAGAGGTIGTRRWPGRRPMAIPCCTAARGRSPPPRRCTPTLRYDPKRDFIPVQGLGASPNMVVTSPARPWRSMAELVAAARAQPETLTYASTGIGTAPHLAVEMLQQVTGIRLIHAPYANGAQAVNDVIGGRVDVMWDYPLTSIPHVRDGRLRALAVTDSQPRPPGARRPHHGRGRPPRGRIPALGRAFRARPHPGAGRRPPRRRPAPVDAGPAGAGILRRHRDGALARDGSRTASMPSRGGMARIAALVARSGARPG